jgi:hypothetical protein
MEKHDNHGSRNHQLLEMKLLESRSLGVLHWQSWLELLTFKNLMHMNCRFYRWSGALLHWIGQQQLWRYGSYRKASLHIV